MDIIKFTNPGIATKMEFAEVVNGITKKLWIERYSKNGEFSFTAPESSGIRKKLTVGSLISHVNTAEVMIVENHEINDKLGEDSEVIITGRSFETFLENRILGSNGPFPQFVSTGTSGLVADYTWNQAVRLISDQIITTYLNDPNDVLQYISVLTTVTGTGLSIRRRFPKGKDAYSILLELLSVDKLGIKSVRPGSFSPLPAGNINTALIVHKGIDRTASLVFSYDNGEIVTADYLWTNKKLKNAVLVGSTWFYTVVLPPDAGYYRRWMYLDAKQLDEEYTEPPVDPTQAAIIVEMQQRGVEALSAQNYVSLAKAEISRESLKARYRIDFDLGDIVTVVGDYNQTSKMIITEYVEIEDETGESGYPTLSLNWS